jgi:hypothetical protein
MTQLLNNRHVVVLDKLVKYLSLNLLKTQRDDRDTIIKIITFPYLVNLNPVNNLH